MRSRIGRLLTLCRAHHSALPGWTRTFYRRQGERVSGTTRGCLGECSALDLRSVATQRISKGIVKDPRLKEPSKNNAGQRWGTEKPTLVSQTMRAACCSKTPYFLAQNCVRYHTVFAVFPSTSGLLETASGACHVQRRFGAQPLQDNNPREGRAEVRRTPCPFTSGYAGRSGRNPSPDGFPSPKLLTSGWRNLKQPKGSLFDTQPRRGRYALILTPVTGFCFSLRVLPLQQVNIDSIPIMDRGGQTCVLES